MLFRFLKVQTLPNGCYNYDNAEYLGAIEHEDYVKYLEFLHYLIDNPNLSVEPDWNNVTCIHTYLDENGEEHTNINNEPYSILGVSYTAPFDDVNLEHVDVYIAEW